MRKAPASAATTTLGALLVVLSLAPTPARGQQANDYDAAESLFAAHELLEAGRPLNAALFANGWPTTKAYQHFTLDLAASTADTLLGVHLGSGAGLELARSDYEAAQLEYAKKARRSVSSTAQLLAEELRGYRTLSGYQGATDSFSPIFLPLRRGKPALRGSWDPGEVQTWRWRDGGGDDQYTLDALGFALWAEAAFAREQLSVKRTEDQAGRAVEYLGSSPREGFLALVALQSAVAKVWELRHRLVLDAKDEKIIPTAELLSLPQRTSYFPTAWTTTSDGHVLVKEDLGARSRLASQAAVLLGLSELARMCADDAPESIRDLFKERTVNNQKVTLLPQNLRDLVVEAALFSFMSIRTLHVSVEGSGRASTVADPRSRGDTITPFDLGLFLMAIESFMDNVNLPPKVKKGLSDVLEEEKRKARTLSGSLSGMFLAWQQQGAGFYDVYNVRMNSSAAKTKSLESQAFAALGLLATHRAVAAGDAASPHLRAAQAAIRWLDEEMWDDRAKAYVDRGKDRKATRFGSAAVLMALRELALETKDGRYLVRYQQFLDSLAEKGFMRDGGAGVAPGLVPEVDFK